MADSDSEKKPFRRRVRYAGTHPRRFEEKYKELDPELDPETVARVLASGKTPAGQHRPILVNEVLAQFAQRPGDRVVDGTLGYGGHTEHLLSALPRSGRVLALDMDAGQLPKTEARLRRLGHDEERLMVRRSNYAGLAAILPVIGWSDGVDFVLADLGLSSMQIDNPERGFSYKHDGPLDMRMNPERGVPASDWLRRCSREKLARTIADWGDEPGAEAIAEAIKEAETTSPLKTTRQLRRVIESAVQNPRREPEEIKTTVARVFQAIRIAVNEEFSALEAFLRQLPACLRSGGRVAILSFHSGEDRRVKHHFRDGFRDGLYREVARDLVRPTFEEMAGNPRASPAKMRWAVRA
ncbi:MAG: 16S rRNA (cytosine(1402)-N(4))-methyltransferase RsmH [Verrucomicrobiota bacterium]